MRYLSKDEQDYWVNIFYDITDYLQPIDYKFSFSISKSNITRFNNLLDFFKKEGFLYLYNQYYETDLNFSTCKKVEHITGGVEFIKFTCIFNKTPLVNCIGLVQLMKDAIDIIGNFYQFDKNGNEICLIQFPVGSIVSTKDSNSDFFVESVEFIRKNTNLYNAYKFQDSDQLLIYHLLKIEKTNTQAIIFSDISICPSYSIKPNRGVQIDSLLN